MLWGVIDPDYHRETSDTPHHKTSNSYIMTHGERCTQMAFYNTESLQAVLAALMNQSPKIKHNNMHCYPLCANMHHTEMNTTTSSPKLFF